ncbi:MAG TPA: C40 family peptidase [Chitinophagaceae bacterium]|nr:C40 family peptidase [Chitinophagaceae bacterium]
MPYAFCTVAVAPLRNQPSHRAEMVSQVLFGEAVIITGEKEEWRAVKSLYDGYEGWTTEHLLTPVDETIARAPAPYVTSSLLNEITSDKNPFQIPMGCSLPGYNATTNTLWDETFRYTGMGRDVTQPYTKQLFQNTIRPWWRAPYLWGGKTALGVDCSGFVQTVFKVLGIPLLRDAYQQAMQGTKVTALQKAQEGDLAFFKNESGKITHVGIVLDGKKIIHASGFVRIDNLTPGGIFTDAGKQTHQLDGLRHLIDFNE